MSDAINIQEVIYYIKILIGKRRPLSAMNKTLKPTGWWMTIALFGILLIPPSPLLLVPPLPWISLPSPFFPQTIAEFDLGTINYEVKSSKCHELSLVAPPHKRISFNFRCEQEAQGWATVLTSSLREAQRGLALWHGLLHIYPVVIYSYKGGFF